MKRILLVENDPDILKTLSEFLTLQGFETTEASGQREAIRILDKNEFDIILLDISLDDGNGFEVCKKVKEKNLPTIFLTASGDENSVVKAFDTGADDYITKPFRPRELISRINNILRRYGRDNALIKTENIVIDTDKCSVTKNGEALKLSALEWQLLTVFLNHRGKMLSRNALLDDIWDAGGNFVNDNTLTVYIKRLREKIEDDPQNPQIIKTVRGLGYRMD